QVALMAGFKKAKEMGYERVMKWRHDMISKNLSSIEKELGRDALNVAYTHYSYDVYYSDFIMEGPLNHMMTVWGFEKYDEEYTTERILLKRIKSLKIPIHFFGRAITPQDDVV